MPRGSDLEASGREIFSWELTVDRTPFQSSPPSESELSCSSLPQYQISFQNIYGSLNLVQGNLLHKTIFISNIKVSV